MAQLNCVELIACHPKTHPYPFLELVCKLQDLGCHTERQK